MDFLAKNIIFCILLPSVLLMLCWKILFSLRNIGIMTVLKPVCSVIMMFPYQNWCVTVLVSLQMEWKEGCAPNLLKVFFLWNTDMWEMSWQVRSELFLWKMQWRNGLSSVANKSCLLKWNTNRDKLSSPSNVTLHCPNVSRESIYKWDWKLRSETKFYA